MERLTALINANRITSRQFWWFVLLASVVAPTLASLADLALYRLTGNPAYAPVSLTYQTIGPAAVVTMNFGTGRLAGMLFWIMLLPAVLAAARRLHDTGRSAAWLLLLVIPVIGWFVLLVWWTNRSDPAGNAYGPAPATASGRPGWLPALGLMALCVAAWMWMTRAGLPDTPGAPPISAERTMTCRLA